MPCFFLFAMKRRWTEKYMPLCFYGQKTTNALYTIDISSRLQKIKYKCLEETHYVKMLLIVQVINALDTNAMYSFYSNKGKGNE